MIPQLYGMLIALFQSAYQEDEINIQNDLRYLSIRENNYSCKVMYAYGWDLCIPHYNQWSHKKWVLAMTNLIRNQSVKSLLDPARRFGWYGRYSQFIKKKPIRWRFMDHTYFTEKYQQKNKAYYEKHLKIW